MLSWSMQLVSFETKLALNAQCSNYFMLMFSTLLRTGQHLSASQISKQANPLHCHTTAPRLRFTSDLRTLLTADGPPTVLSAAPCALAPRTTEQPHNHTTTQTWTTILCLPEPVQVNLVRREAGEALGFQARNLCWMGTGCARAWNCLTPSSCVLLRKIVEALQNYKTSQFSTQLKLN